MGAGGSVDGRLQHDAEDRSTENTMDSLTTLGADKPGKRRDYQSRYCGLQGVANNSNVLWNLLELKLFCPWACAPSYSTSAAARHNFLADTPLNFTAVLTEGIGEMLTFPL